MVDDRQRKIEKAVKLVEAQIFLPKDVMRYVTSNENLLLSIANCLYKKEQLSEVEIKNWFDEEKLRLEKHIEQQRKTILAGNQEKKLSGQQEEVLKEQTNRIKLKSIVLTTAQAENLPEQRDIVVGYLITQIVEPRVRLLLEYREKIVATALELGLQKKLPASLQKAINGIKFPRTKQLLSKVSLTIVMSYLSKQKDGEKDLKKLSQEMDGSSTDFETTLTQWLEKTRKIPPLTFEASDTLPHEEKSKLEALQKIMSTPEVVALIEKHVDSRLLRSLLGYYLLNFRSIALNTFQSILSNLDYLQKYPEATFLLLKSEKTPQERNRFLINQSKQDLLATVAQYPVGAVRFLDTAPVMDLRLVTRYVFEQKLKNLSTGIDEDEFTILHQNRVSEGRKLGEFFGLRKIGVRSLSATASDYIIDRLKKFEGLKAEIRLLKEENQAGAIRKILKDTEEGLDGEIIESLEALNLAEKLHEEGVVRFSGLSM